MRDIAIEYIRKRKYYTPYDLAAFILAAPDVTMTEGEIFQNPTAATKTAPETFQKEVGALNFVGTGFSAAGSLIQGRLRVPHDLDSKFPVGFRVNWSSGSASAGTATFVLLLELIKKSISATTGVMTATINDALNTVIGSSACFAAASLNLWSGRGIKNRLGINRKDIEDGAAMEFTLQLSAVGTIAASDVTFLGLEMDYVPQLCQGQGRESDCPMQSDGVK